MRVTLFRTTVFGAATILVALAPGQAPKSATPTGSGSVTSTTAAPGGGTASAEAEARMYRAIVAASDDVAAQLRGKYPYQGYSFVLYNASLAYDVKTERVLKIPLDRIAADIDVATVGEGEAATDLLKYRSWEDYDAALDAYDAQVQRYAEALSKWQLQAKSQHNGPTQPPEVPPNPDLQDQHCKAKQNMAAAHIGLEESLGAAFSSVTDAISLAGSVLSLNTAPLTVSTTATGVPGPTDADALIASRLVKKLAASSAAYTVYAPTLLPPFQPAPLTPDQTSHMFDRKALMGADPAAELSAIQSEVSWKIASGQNALLLAYNAFTSSGAAPTVPAFVLSANNTLSQSTVYTTYQQLATDLKAAASSVAPTAVSSPAASPSSSGGSAAAAAPATPPTTSLLVAAVRADVEQLRAELRGAPTSPEVPTSLSQVTVTGPAEKGSKVTGSSSTTTIGTIGQPGPGPSGLGSALDTLADALQCPKIVNLDRYIQLGSSLNSLATSLASAPTPFLTATSEDPSAAAPDTIANAALRGWQTLNLLSIPNTKLLRVHLEMSQGTDKVSSWLWRFWKDSSAVAVLSFNVLNSDGKAEFAGSSVAYLPMVNGDSTTDVTKPARILEDEPIDPSPFKVPNN